MLRILTVEHGIRRLKWRSKRHFSIIRLKGNWLMSAGFKPGQKVRVQVEAGRLIITNS